MTDELLRTSSGEDRTDALHARVQLVLLTSSRFGQGTRRCGRAAPQAKASFLMNLPPAVRLRRAARIPLSESRRCQSQVFCTRAAGAHAATFPPGVRSITGGKEEAA
jgi:hypothetical protein